jgi:alcohol dehydrogenase
MQLPHDPQPGTFDFNPRTRVVFGPGTVDRVGALAGEWNAERVLLVTDPHLVEAGHAARARRSLEAAGQTVVLYDAVRENPTTEDVDACLAVARDATIDTIVGLGGGSSLDTAKGCNFLLTNGGVMADYWGVGKANKPMLPLIAIPTTAGTGSECQSFALIADARTHQKMACGDPKAAARVAILDPQLTVTQPRMVAADTGIDALTHAVETAVTKKRSDLSMMFSREALRLIVSAFPKVLESPDDLTARGRMLLAAAYAGTAIENSMLGAAHAAANPLTAHFNIIHGQAVGLMLPPVIRFNAQERSVCTMYRDLAVGAQLVPPGADPRDAVAALLNRIEQCLDLAGLPRTLAAAGVPRDAVPMLAEEAATQWTGTFNPRPVGPAEFMRLYDSVCLAQPSAEAPPLIAPIRQQSTAGADISRD